MMGNSFFKSGLICLLFIVMFSFEACKSSKTKTSSSDAQKSKVQLVRNDAEQKVDVLIDGELFTSYMYPSSIKKPVLYPLVTSEGTKITRGFPLEPMPGERVDHPHHVGVWFNYGDVNGLDFWNNSDSIKMEKRDGYGTILHKEFSKLEEYDDHAELGVVMHWNAPSGRNTPD